jgi:23S rRNA (cytosine1962-C5)-methyltransferase
MAMHQLVLKPNRERSVLLKHQWIFSGAVERFDQELKNGDVVEIVSAEGRFLAVAHFFRSNIMARILSFEREEINTGFFFRKIKSAYALRQSLGLTDRHTNMFRLVHGEGDGLPGLIIDIYHHAACIQCHTEGMLQSLDLISEALMQIKELKVHFVFQKSAVKTKGTLPKVESKKNHKVVALENGIKFTVDVEHGQKTGFFIDQRDNRQLLSHYTRGCRVLNLFSYSGGFSMYALKGGAERVVSVDSSAPACEWNMENTILNGHQGRHEIHCMDVFEFLKTCNEQFDIIIVDPPAFAKQLSVVKKASVKYRNLNTAALKWLKKGGLLFTFSCSQAMSKEHFQQIIFKSAIECKADLKIIHRMSQSPDHPVSIYHPEGEYLKGLAIQLN